MKHASFLELVIDEFVVSKADMVHRCILVEKHAIFTHDVTLSVFEELAHEVGFFFVGSI